jgi:gliding motility-associated-like protein
MKNFLLFLGVFLSYSIGFAQSDNCNSATVLTLNASGSACFSGTNASATSSLTTNGCIPNPVNEVWFTYTVMGPQNNFTVTPGTLQDAVITIYVDGCNTGTYDFCTTASGAGSINTSFGLAIGSQVWISIASNSLTDGTFQFCVQSVPPPPGEGNTCNEAISVCQKNQSFNVPNMGIYTASGVKASCFQGAGSNPTQEMWISFCVSQSGTITWNGTPANNFTEYDWSMWDITNGCPGTEVACNYSWNQQNGVRFGMGCATTDCDPAFNAVAGRCYAIQIVNWSNNGTGFSFSGIGGTALISPNVNFSLSQTNQCNIPVTVSFSTLAGHAGVINWDFGNGNTWSGTGAPANQIYTEPGVYAVTASGGTGECFSTQTRYVYVYEPLQVTHTVVDDFCNDTNGGAISLFPTGGNGVYTYSWTPNVSSGPNATGLAPGNYSVQVCNTTCAQCVTVPVTLTGIVCCGVDIDFGPTRLCMSDSPINLNPSITGALNYTVEWTPNDFLADPFSENTFFIPPSAGTYTFTFAVDNTADPGGCVTPRNVTYTVVDVFPAGQTTPTSCPGTCDGAVQITGVSGGLSPYVVTWDNGLSSANAHSDLCAGTYTATVTEAGGCEGYLALELEDAVGFLVDAGTHDCATDPINPGECLVLTGVSSITPSFFCDNTNHSWSGNTAIADPVGTGQGTPSNTTQSVTVSGTTGDDFLASICFTINHQDHNQLRNIFITTPDGTQIFYFLDATYSFTTASGSVTYCFDQSKVDNYTGPLNGIWTLTLQDFRRNPTATGSITNITITTCRPVYPDLWSPTTYMNGDPENLITEVCPMETTTYTLTVTDPNGCSISDEITVLVGPCPCDANASISLSGNLNICEGECSEIQFQVGDGIGPYEIIYTDGTTNYTLEVSGNSQLAAGIYSTSVCPTESVTYTLVSVYDFGASCFADTFGFAQVIVAVPNEPLFTQLGPYCQDVTPDALPNTSDNGISGSWNPSAISTGSSGNTLYTFTPDAGQCALSASMSITILPNTTGSETYSGCIGDGYSVNVNGTLYDESNPSGTETLTNANNCDSVVTVNLIFSPNSTGTETYSGCEGDGYSVTVNGTLYNESNRTGTETLIAAAANGCDSVVTVNLVFHPETSSTVSHNGCLGDGFSVTVNGTIYDESNPTGTEILTNVNSCDSVVTINLSFLPNITGAVNYSGCEGDGYSVVVNGNLYNEANPTGTEVFVASGGCDSTVTVNLLFFPSSSSVVNYNGCEGDNYSVTVNGVVYDESNPSGTEMLTNANNCDSTVTVNLIFSPNSIGAENYMGCEGDGYSVTVNGVLYNESNPSGTETLLSANGCDSVVTINLQYFPETSSSIVHNGCEGDGFSVTVNGIVYDELNPIGTEILTNANGCDSTVTINLTFSSSLTGNVNYNGCEGDGHSVTVNGTLYNESNPNGTELFVASGGCDSLVTINLVYLPNTAGSETYTGCQGDGYSVTVNGVLYNQSNPTGSETLMNANGCDSVVTINLAYLPNTTGAVNYTGCEGDGFNVTVNGTLYNESNPSGTETLTNANNCDSVVTVTLVFNVNHLTFASATSCNPSDTGVFVNNFTNQFGCDSIHTFTVAYNESDSTFEALSSCNPADEGVVVFGLTNQFGCDSVHTITTSLLPSSATTVSVGTCDPAEVGDEDFVFSNEFGCDSVHTVTTFLHPVTDHLLTATPDTILFSESSLLSVTEGVAFEWAGLAETDSFVVVVPQQDTEFFVEVTDENGCVQELSVTVYVFLRNVNLLMPDAFTPNGDGINDIFEITNKADFREIEMRVYNRWGQLVHEGEGQDHGWDGTFNGEKQNSDMYVYYVRALPFTSDEYVSLKANFTLIR